MKPSSMPLTLMQCRVRFGCQGLPGFVAAVPACLNHFKSKWCNEQSYLVLFPLFCQATHKYLDPTQRLTNLLKERWIGESDFPGGKVWWIYTTTRQFSPLQIAVMQNKCFHSRQVSKEIELYLLNISFLSLSLLVEIFLYTFEMKLNKNKDYHNLWIPTVPRPLRVLLTR